MKRWRGLALGTLTIFLLSAPAADAAEATTATVRSSVADDNAARDAERAAKAAARAERQAERAAARAERQRAIAEAKAARVAAKDTPDAAPVRISENPPAAVAQTAAPIVEALSESTTEGAAPAVPASTVEATAPAASLTEKKAARAERQQALADRKAERAAVKAERKAALAAAKEEKRAAKAAEKAEKKTARAEKVAQNRRDRGSRYKTLFTDNGFTYYMDATNTRWVPRPYNSSEYMIDAWVRLVENTTGEPLVEDGKIRPTKYFLEHYYISPQRREIMFISQLEVTGRPENAVKERPYDPRNWEQLVPGSIEDAIFEAVTKRMSSAPGAKTGGMSVRDMVEEYARISF